MGDNPSFFLNLPFWQEAFFCIKEIVLLAELHANSCTELPSRAM